MSRRLYGGQNQGGCDQFSLAGRGAELGQLLAAGGQLPHLPAGSPEAERGAPTSPSMCYDGLITLVESV